MLKIVHEAYQLELIVANVTQVQLAISALSRRRRSSPSDMSTTSKLTIPFHLQYSLT